MSATTLNLPYTRFVAQVSTAPARSKSTYLALMEENLAALQKCPWKESADVPAALADHDFTAPSHLSGAYDAFKMTGNYSASTMTEIAYAGMAAYRFKIPDSALVSGSEVALSSIALPISRDRYLKSGVRVAAVLSDDDEPSADWDAVRGSGGILLSAQLTQSVAYLLAGAPGKDTLELAASSFAGLAETGHAYLWIYLTLEDYTEHWDMYSANEQRLYAIEGSAMLVGGSAEFTFAGEVAPDTPSAAAQTRLITTSYPASSVKLSGGGTLAARAHRVFAALGTNCLSVVGGKNVVSSSGTYYGSFWPALAVRRGIASSGTGVGIVRFVLLGDYDFDEESKTWPKDLAADWYDTPPGRALLRGDGVTGFAIAPLYGAANIDKPTASGSSYVAYKYFLCYLSTKDGCWRLGTCTLRSDSDNVIFVPNVVQVAFGGDLLLLTKVASSNTIYSPEWVNEWCPECVSVGDGVINVGERTVPFEGTITGLGSCDGSGSGCFLVAGDLVSVGGVPCRHVAKINANNDPISVAPLSIDSAHDLVPNVYDNFRLVSAGGKHFALGDFTALGGVACGHGAAIVTDEAITAQDEYIVDVVGLSDTAYAYVVADRAAIEIR